MLCGVNTGLPGFSNPDDKGNWTGFDVDFCRAVAAAIFDDPKKVKFVPLDASERFTRTAATARSTCCRATRPGACRARPTSACISPAVSYYDGQGFMLPQARNVDTALELDGSKVCVQAGHDDAAATSPTISAPTT